MSYLLAFFIIVVPLPQEHEKFFVDFISSRFYVKISKSGASENSEAPGRRRLND